MVLPPSARLSITAAAEESEENNRLTDEIMDRLREISRIVARELAEQESEPEFPFSEDIDSVRDLEARLYNNNDDDDNDDEETFGSSEVHCDAVYYDAVYYDANDDEADDEWPDSLPELISICEERRNEESSEEESSEEESPEEESPEEESPEEESPEEESPQETHRGVLEPEDQNAFWGTFPTSEDIAWMLEEDEDERLNWPMTLDELSVQTERMIEAE